MRIVRNSASTGFTQVPNVAVRDKRLSYKARGILAVLLSHKDGWQIDAHSLADDSPDGRKAILSGLRELVDCGYVVYVNRRGSDGRMRKEMTVYEVPPDPGPGSGQEAVDNSPDRGSETAPRSEDKAAGGTEVPSRNVGSRNVGSRNVGSRHLYRRPTRRPEEDHPEDQQAAQKISQSARTAEAVRWLTDNYGLTDEEASTAWKSAEARARDEIKNPIPYLRRMAERGHLADIVGAIQTAAAPDPAAQEPEPEPAEPPPLRALEGKATSSSTDTQPSLLIHAVPDDTPEDEDPLFDRATGEDHRTAAPLLADLKRKWNTGT